MTVVSPGGTTAVTSKDHFKFLPTVTGLTPAVGSITGSTSVAVTGKGFLLGKTATVLKFGATKAKSVNCASATACTVTAPAHAAGTVDVTVTVNKASSAANPPGDQFA